MNKRETGSRYEEAAAAFLQKQGLTLLEKNFRSRFGEIDLILKDGAYLVFTEVKYRADGSLGYPLEAVDLRKQKRIRYTARYFMYIRKIPEDTPCRFDVVGFTGGNLQWILDAF